MAALPHFSSSPPGTMVVRPDSKKSDRSSIRARLQKAAARTLTDAIERVGRQSRRSTLPPACLYSQPKDPQDIMLDQVFNGRGAKPGLPELIETMKQVNHRVKLQRDYDDDWEIDFDAAMEKIKEDPENLKHVSHFIDGYWEIAQAACEIDPFAAEFAREDCRNSKEFMFPLISKLGQGEIFLFAGDDLKKDLGCGLIAALNGCPLSKLHIEIKKHKPTMIALLQFKVGSLADLTGIHSDDEAVVKAAIGGIGGEQIRFASERIRNMHSFMQLALENGDETVFQHAGPLLKLNKLKILELIQINWKIIMYVDTWFRDDNEFVGQAIEIDVRIYPFISRRLKSDLDIFHLVKKGMPLIAFHYSHLSIHEKIGVFMKEMEKNEHYISNISDDLIRERGVFEQLKKLAPDAAFWDDEKLMGRFVCLNWEASKFASERLKNRPSFIRLIVHREDPKRFSVAGEQITGNRQFAFEFLQANGMHLYYLSQELKRDLDIVIAACRQNPEAIRFADDLISKNVEKLLAILECVPLVFGFIDKELQVEARIQQYKPDDNEESDEDLP